MSGNYEYIVKIRHHTMGCQFAAYVDHTWCIQLHVYEFVEDIRKKNVNKATQ